MNSVIAVCVSCQVVSQVESTCCMFNLKRKIFYDLCRGGSSPKILGGIAPSAPSSLSPFSPFSETEKTRTSYRPTFEIYHCHFCCGLDPDTCRNEARPERPTAGVFLWWEQRALPRQLGDLGERCKLPQRGPGRSPGKLRFWNILGPQKSCQNGQLALNLGGNK